MGWQLNVQLYESLVVLQLSTLGDVYCEIKIIRKELATPAHATLRKHSVLLCYVLPQLLLRGERPLTAVIWTGHIMWQLLMAAHVGKYFPTTNALLTFQHNLSSWDF